MLHPSMAKELVAQRAAELEAEAAVRTVCPGHSCSPGPLALRAGRALVALGWRLGGTAALPPPVRRRLA